MIIPKEPYPLIRFTCIACILFLAGWSARSQPRYTIQHLTNERGLPGNSVTGMEWDQEHQLLWIGTNAGITRWNGQYMVPETKGEGRIYRMTSYGRRGIYVTNEWGYIYKVLYSGLASESFQPDNQLFIAYNRAIHQPPQFLFKYIDQQTDQHVLPQTILPLDSGTHNMLVYFRKDILLRWKGHITRVATTENEGYFFRGKEIWLIDGHRVRIFDRATRTFGKPLSLDGKAPGLTGYTILHDVNADLPLVYGAGKLYQLKRAGAQLQMTLLTDKLPKRLDIKMVRLLAGTGCLAIGDFTAGVYLLRPASATPVGAVPSTSDAPSIPTYGQALLPDGNILTNDRTLISKRAIVYNKGPLDANFCLYSTGPYIYSAKGEFVCRYNKLSGQTKKYPLPYRVHSAAYAATEGRSFLITQAGIYELKEKGIEQVYGMPPGSDGLQQWLDCNAATEFRKGVIAIGGNAYLALFDIHTRKPDIIPTVKDAPIRALWRHDSCLFMGTYGKGIFALKHGHISAMPLDKQGYLKYTHSFQPDNKGYLYLSSNNGLFRVSEKAFLAAAEQPTPLYYHYLGRRDGLFTTEFNGGCSQCAIQLPDGTLSFASMNGLVWLHPDSMAAYAPPGIILVDSVQVDSRRYGYQSAGLKSLPYGTDDISFRINIPYWGNEENLYCWYRLQHFKGTSSTSWIRFNPASRHDFGFSSLKKGNYRFEVALINGYESADIQFLQIPFTISAPWYLEWYGILLWFALWVVVILVLIRWRTARINKRALLLEQTVEERTTELNARLNELAVANRLKERMIAVVSHNIIAPLRYMHEVSAALNDDTQSYSPAMQRKAFSAIKDTSRKMELLTVNLLSWIRMQHQDYKNLRAEYFHLSEITTRVYHILNPLAQEMGVEIVRNIDLPAAINQYKDALQVILYNLTLNAVLYSGKGKVGLSVEAAGSGKLHLMVTDTGKGMSQEKVQELLGSKANPTAMDDDNPGQGFGYAIIKDALELIHGTLDIVSEPGKGTKVMISFESMVAD